MLRKIALVTAVWFCLGTGQQAKADKNLGFYFTIVPWGEGDTSDSPSEDLDFCYGVGMDMEWELLDFLSLGGSLQYRNLNVDTMGDSSHELHLDPTLRLFYPGESLRPYARLRVGASLMWPSDDPVDLDFGAGWNIDVMGGIAYYLDFIGFSLELGYGHSTVESYVRGGGDHPLTISYESLLLNLGLVLVL
ncbi:MAG: hypothetical protein JXR96_00070 [Deltaproteobacteria bacterium]|nr:hypothetical protein [Deltaproteobacteria bacterium]